MTRCKPCLGWKKLGSDNPDESDVANVAQEEKEGEREEWKPAKNSFGWDQVSLITSVDVERSADRLRENIFSAVVTKSIAPLVGGQVEAGAKD